MLSKTEEPQKPYSVHTQIHRKMEREKNYYIYIIVKYTYIHTAYTSSFSPKCTYLTAEPNQI